MLDRACQTWTGRTEDGDDRTRDDGDQREYGICERQHLRSNALTVEWAPVAVAFPDAWYPPDNKRNVATVAEGRLVSMQANAFNRR